MSKIKGFYSALDKAADALKRNKGTGQEFITELSKIKGVKPAEMQARKLERIIEMPKMSKEEFLAKLKEFPPPQLRETQIGEPTQKEIRSLAEQLMHDDAVEEAGMTRRNRFETEDDVDSIFEDKMYNEEQKYLDMAREQIIDEGGGTKYNELKTEGGQNYREILMRLPSDAKKNQKRMFELEAKERRSSVGRNFGNILPEEMEELNQLRELAKNPKKDYQSKHWEEPNVLAHMRVQDRVGPNGEKILHVEEIQSDWHQKARDIRKKEIERLMKTESITKKDALARVPENYGYNNLTPDESAELQVLLKKENEGGGLPAKDLNRARELETRMADVVPDAPFKKNWHELAMKRLLNYAAENGYNKIAITPGKNQIDRYEEELRKNLDRLEYEAYQNPDTGKTVYELSGTKNGKEVFSKEDVSADELRDLVGKDMFSKIETGQGQSLAEERPLRPNWKRFEGKDISIGGEGMKGFYDQMIPSYLNEFGKKYGTQVSPFDIETKPSQGFHVRDTTNPESRPTRFMSATEAANWRRANNYPDTYVIEPQPAETSTFHSFDITPEMREEIANQGLPMFSKGGAVFDPEGEDYDYDTAKSAGLGATGEGENEGHWGSVTMASEQDKKLHGLPDNSYMLLKGRKHETWSKAENAEKARGSEIVKRGSRYYSIPKINPQKRGGRVHVSQNPDTMLLDLISKN